MEKHFTKVGDLKKFALVLMILSVTVTGNATGTAGGHIDWSQTYQTIDGFGASEHGAKQLTSSQAELFFGTLGFSLFRIGTPENGSCDTVNSSCATSGDSVANMKAAVHYGARIFATSWTPPAIMKTNNSINCTDNGGSGKLKATSYSNFAAYLSNFIKSLKTYEGISLYALSPQNEPEGCHSYDSAVWSAQNFHDFILHNLGPELAKNGQSETMIIMPEAGHSDQNLAWATTCMSDPKCAFYVGVNAFHDYDDSFDSLNPYPTKHYWMTEVSAELGKGIGPSLCNGCWDPSIADAMMWAGVIDYSLAEANESAWLYWWMVNVNSADNEGLMSPTGEISLRSYVMGNYSKFIRPGYVRIFATHSPLTGITISAYKDVASKKFAVVVTNQNAEEVPLKTSLVNFTAQSVTPWVTSVSDHLIVQSNVSTTSNYIKYMLPAKSVVTFVGTAN